MFTKIKIFSQNLLMYACFLCIIENSFKKVGDAHVIKLIDLDYIQMIVKEY